jgi:pseudaminic acid cytidylyltransferase
MTAASAVAIIPARAGSKRIPSKNIRPFDGVPMIGRSIDAAKRSGLFGRILVSTDSEEITAIALRFGAECAFKRPPELADDRTPTAPVIHHALSWLAERGENPRYACCIYATAPMMQIDDLQAAYQALISHGCGSVLPVTTFGFPIRRALTLSESGQAAMMWPEHQFSRSQDLPEAYHDAGQFYWLNVSRFMGEPRLYFDDSQAVIIPRWRVQDIDTPDDWIRAEMIYRVLQSAGRLN